MSNEQTFQIIASPADRWQFAVLLLHKDLKFKGKRRTALARFRNALGLVGPTEAFLGERKGRVKLASDKRTKNLFTITDEIVEFANDCLNQLELSGAQYAGLEPVLSQLDARQPTTAIGVIGDAFDPDEEDWAPSTAPILDEPDRYIMLNADLLRRADGDFERYVALYLKEAEPPEEEQDAPPTQLSSVPYSSG